jgi:ubiquinone/menaquinone biosynthesis C-methylase UbiE
MQFATAVKYILYQSGLYRLADACAFQWQRWKYGVRNRAYKRSHPETILPPDYYVYETFRLDYAAYIEHGLLAAKEIAAWATPYLSKAPEKILDWGCGCARITRQLPNYFPSSSVYGCDTNTNYINWNKANIPGVHFDSSGARLSYPDATFKLIIGFSVLTHIASEEQEASLAAIHRVLAVNGICFLTTHGTAFFNQLTKNEIAVLKAKGCYTRSGYQTGHRSVTTWHYADFLKKLLQPRFEILEYHPGLTHPEKAGGQDLWILRKK